MGAFKAYDFRGIFGKDFNLETIYKFGFFLPKLLHADKVLIGRDMRLFDYTRSLEREKFAARYMDTGFLPHGISAHILRNVLEERMETHCWNQFEGFSEGCPARRLRYGTGRTGAEGIAR